MTVYRLLITGARASGACLAAALMFAGCNTKDYLDVQAPSRIPAANLENPENAQLLVNGAVADFECAFGSYIVAGGLIGEELEDATQTSDRYPYDQRRLIPGSTRYSTSSCEGIGTYSPLQTARVSADNIRRLLEGWTDQQVPNRQLLLATAAAYEGYSDVLLGEGFCSVALSVFNPDKTIAYGGEITPAQAFDSAITRFSQAITAGQTAGAAAQSIVTMALVGRARAKLDKGDLAGAKTAAALVPAAFVFTATASAVTTRRYNRVWADNGLVGTDANSASSVGAYYRTLNDPRVVVTKPDVPVSRIGVPIYVQGKYANAASSMRLATGDEAQLIVAEADITANPANALLIINSFRQKGNEPLLVTPTAAELKAALIEERRRALFLEGQHLGDLIRYQLPFSPAAGAAFPAGGTYGTQRCMPLPDVERLNNPVLHT